MARPNTQVSIAGTKLRESERAVLFQVQEISGTPIDPFKTEWFPFSQVTKMTWNKNPDKMLDELDTMVVSEWILKQKELI